MDEVDQAQANEQADRDAALQATLARVAAANVPRDARADETCIDCDQPIEAARLAVLRKTSRCASCAYDYERRHAWPK
jgi:RNA polymerase-binding transcription factor DksA